MHEIAPKVKLKSVTTVSGAGTTNGTFGGASISTANGGVSKNSYLVEENFFQELSVNNVSGNTDITEYPYLSRNADYVGRDTVILTRGEYKKQLNLTFSTSVGEDVKQVTGINENETYLRYSYEWLAAKHAAGGSAAVYSGAIRNDSCWLAGENLTGIPYSNSTGDAQRNGVLIAPRYLAGVNHWPLAVGATVTFKKSDGSDVTRTVVGASETGTGAGDLRICVLDSDVPEGIKIYPVAGRWIANAVSAGSYFNTFWQFCGVFINRNRDASFIHKCDYEILPWSKNSHTIAGVVVTDAITTTYLDAAWSGNKLPEFNSLSSIRIDTYYGDSGSGILVKVASGLAALSVFSSPQGGPFFDEAYTNALIASARLDAISRGNGTPTLQTVTVAPDPTA